MSFNHENTTGCPCKGCEERHPGCHDRCEKFAEWRRKLDAKRENERKYIESCYTMGDGKKRQMWRDHRYSRQARQRKVSKE